MIRDGDATFLGNINQIPVYINDKFLGFYNTFLNLDEFNTSFLKMHKFRSSKYYYIQKNFNIDDNLVKSATKKIQNQYFKEMKKLGLLK